MKLIKQRKCKNCGSTAVLTICRNSIIIGCDEAYCFLCWPNHHDAHQEEWANMTDAEKAQAESEWGEWNADHRF